MLIVSQDKDGIINFENITAIRLIVNLEDNKRNMIAIDTVNAERYTVAKYVTEERAKEVIREIIKKYEKINLGKYFNAPMIELHGDKSFVYEMPKE